MTFDQFLTQYVTMTPAEAEEHFGDSETHKDAKSVRVFFGCAFVNERHDGMFWTMIDRDEYVGTFEEVAKVLFFDFYVSECQKEHSVVSMVQLYNDFCDWQDIPPASADEALTNLLGIDPQDRTSRDNENILFLQWFIETWDNLTDFY